MFSSIWSYLKHNYPFVIGIVSAGLIVFWAYGCQSQVTSIINTPKMVTREELKAEVDAFLAQAELRFKSLDRQDEFKTELFNTAVTFVTEGKINPLAVLMSAGNIAGLGAVVSAVRKDTRLKAAKSEIETLSKALKGTEV